MIKLKSTHREIWSDLEIAKNITFYDYVGYTMYSQAIDNIFEPIWGSILSELEDTIYHD